MNKENNYKNMKAIEKEYELIEKEIEKKEKKYQNITWQVISIIISIYAFCFTENKAYAEVLSMIAIIIPLVLVIVVIGIYVADIKNEKKLIKRKSELEKKLFGRSLNIKKEDNFIKVAQLAIIVMMLSPISFNIVRIYIKDFWSELVLDSIIIGALIALIKFLDSLIDKKDIKSNKKSKTINIQVKY